MLTLTYELGLVPQHILWLAHLIAFLFRNETVQFAFSLICYRPTGSHQFSNRCWLAPNQNLQIVNCIFLLGFFIEMYFC